jgi:hypothetical protein
MKKVLEWWRGRKWVYLGQTSLILSYTNRDTNVEVRKADCMVHFYAWQNNMKKRKYKYAGPDPDTFERDQWYHKNVVPWLEGGDIWKPIAKPIAVQGNLVNFYKGQQQP